MEIKTMARTAGRAAASHFNGRLEYSSDALIVAGLTSVSAKSVSTISGDVSSEAAN